MFHQPASFSLAFFMVFTCHHVLCDCEEFAGKLKGFFHLEPIKQKINGVFDCFSVHLRVHHFMTKL